MHGMWVVRQSQTAMQSKVYDGHTVTVSVTVTFTATVWHCHSYGMFIVATEIYDKSGGKKARHAMILS
jgi:hypothetical protein